MGGWVGFEPTHHGTAAIVKLHQLRGDHSHPQQNKSITDGSVLKLQRLSDELEVFDELDRVIDEERDLDTDFEDAGVVDDETKISIINSFLLRDLERARDLVRAGKLEKSSPLLKYLSVIDRRHPDLLDPAGEEIVRKNVSLSNTPLGRWPSASTQSMSLMQQFAINLIDQDFNGHGLFSINGPPGTGKTTMIRDLVANNIVNRARVLSGLDHSHSAFVGEITVKVGDKVKYGVKRLMPELSGYEMVVVSSNNAAVENISKELPQTKAIAKEFSHLNYLKSIAQKLAAEHDDKNNIYPLSEHTDCWGLVAAALGNSNNRESLCSKIQFSTIESLNHITSNEIAYNHKMIHGSDDAVERGEFAWGKSGWFDVYGEVRGKHYVAEQGEFVLHLLYQYLERCGQLPDCYIISPFKDVTVNLLIFLRRNFRYQTIEKGQFNHWLKGRVGTVHTFQGKEKQVVLFVLGGSNENKGAVNWASSKPNLLNVAVTRAKNRVFLVGSKQVWGSLSHFSFANSQLPARAVAHEAELA